LAKRLNLTSQLLLPAAAAAAAAVFLLGDDEEEEEEEEENDRSASKVPAYQLSSRKEQASTSVPNVKVARQAVMTSQACWCKDSNLTAFSSTPSAACAAS